MNKSLCWRPKPPTSHDGDFTPFPANRCLGAVGYIFLNSQEGLEMNRDDRSSLDRRKFIKLSAAAAVGGGSLLKFLEAAAAEAPKTEEMVHRNERPTMTYRRLGRTNFMASRLVFGCGAALAGGKAVRLLDRAFDAGINYYDTGRPYGDSESRLAPFLKAHRDEVWVTSKAAHMGWPDKRIRPDQGKEAAKLYTEQLEESLRELKTDYIDAYFIMGIEDEGFIRNEDLYGAFLKAKQAGKVGYYGLSSHTNVQKMLEAAIETGWYDLAMISVTPGGWYDWDAKMPDKNMPGISGLLPILTRAQEAGIGLVGMKAARTVGNDPTQFDKFYSKALMEAPLNPFQRAYAYILQQGMDVVNSNLTNFKILEENLKAVNV
jgi:aryl-alcohol dehydrogenase-like predicted oxidoreductase